MEQASGGYPGWFRYRSARAMAWGLLGTCVAVLVLLALLVVVTFVGFQLEGEDAGVRSTPLTFMALLVGLPFAGLAFGLLRALKNFKAMNEAPSNSRESPVQ